MKKDNKVTGNRGEELASNYLQKKGYKIEERNFRTRFGEIDIVCWDGPILVFVEVKTKKGHDFGEPEEMVNRTKLMQVQRMGEVYLELNTQKTLPASRQVENSITSGPGLSDWGPLRPGPGERWSGQCRVDVVAIVLCEDGEVESIHHYEAVY